MNVSAQLHNDESHSPLYLPYMSHTREMKNKITFSTDAGVTREAIYQVFPGSLW